MRELLMTSTVLILAVFLLRRLFGARIPARLQYALWLLVALRLLCPFSLSASSLSVMNAAPRAAEVVAAGQEPAAFAEAGTQTAQSVAPRPLAPAGAQSGGHAEALRAVWLAGSLCVAAGFAAANLRFARRLRRGSEAYDGPGARDCPVPVRYAPQLASPCVFGVFRPVIYINDKTLPPDQMRCILAHEAAHCRQLDPLWALVRIACCAVWWFRPLVWLAAARSKQDAELACDEAVLRGLDERGRLQYGYLLLSAARCSAAGGWSAASPFAAGRSGVANRVRRAVTRTKTAAGAVVAVLLACAVLVSCTFTGAKAFSFMEAPCAFYAAQEQADGSVLLAAQELAEVCAPESGKVERVEEGCVRIRHSGGVVTELQCLGEIQVREGSRVKRGEPVAQVAAANGEQPAAVRFSVYKDGAAQEVWDYLEPFRLFTFSASGEMIRDCAHAVSTVYYNGTAYSDEADALLSLSEAVGGRGYSPVRLASETNGAWHAHINLNVFGEPASVRIYTDGQLRDSILAASDAGYYTGEGMQAGSVAYHFSSEEEFALYQYAIFPALTGGEETFYIDMSWENGDRLIAAVRTAGAV